MSGAIAQDEGRPIGLELNRLETVGDACRAYLMIENRSAALETFRLDLFALDTDGVVARRLAIQLGPLPGDKTVIKLFDFTDVTCEGVGSVLLNEVLACEGESGPREDCLSQIAVGTRSVPFLK
ncbi:Tat pathway signal protein [Salinarimonas sp.]|uniref:Tat pathway signal protein n=1 Tax=Salinarimonas sp. TaxID=2766526 RepID=UPI0032D9AD23